MIQFLKQLTLIAVLVVASTVLGRTQDVDEVLSHLQKKYASLRDLYAAFTQTVRFGVTGATQSFEGKVWMKKGNRYRIEMENRTIVTDGASVWTYSDLNRQVFIDVFRDDPKAITPDRMLTDIPKNYVATLLERETIDGTKTHVLKLSPRDTRSLVKSMKVWVDPSEWLMVKVEVLDVSGNLTTYRIREVAFNGGLSDRIFHFDIPPDVEVIDLRPSTTSPSDSP